MSLHFGEFELDQERRQLLSEGQAVPLEPKAYELLCLLVERRPRALSRAQIRDVVWPGVFISESTLSQAVTTVRQALGDDARQARYIRTAHGFGYGFCAELREDGDPPETLETPQGIGAAADAGSSPRRAAAPSGWSLRRHGWVGVIVVVIAVLVALGLSREAKSPPTTLRVRPITSEPGPESLPSISPDGKFLAYVKDEDIYVKLVDGGEPLLLSEDIGGQWAVAPAWSSDGRQIAFVRQVQTGNGSLTGQIHVVPALGGPERHVTSQAPGTHLGLSWSPNAKHLAFPDRASPDEAPGIVLYSLETGERHSLTTPGDTRGDSVPRFSPDGRTVAFVRTATYLVADLYVVPVDGGEERRLTEGSFYLVGLDWAPDGRSIVFSTRRPGGAGDSSLWRVPVSEGEPEPLDFGEEGQWPTVARSGSRLAYQRMAESIDIWRIAGPGSLDDETPAIRLVASSQTDMHPRYSADGTQIAFTSTRSGAPEIWICNADGSEPRQLTFLDATMSAGAVWSPDGRQIAFGSTTGEDWDPYVVSASGGVPRRPTKRSGFPVSWSRDGRWLYFNSKGDARSELWKVPGEGGKARRVAAHGVTAFESSDGRLLFVGRRSPTGEGPRGVWRMPVEGGEETQVWDRAGSTWWTLMERGIVRVDRDATPNRLEFFDLESGEVTWSRALDIPVFSSFISASPDGRFVIFTGTRVETDIMLVEHFE